MIKQVTLYYAVCDRCGREYDDIENGLGVDEYEARDLAFDCDWEHIGGRDLCPDCWHYNDNDEITEVKA